MFTGDKPAGDRPSDDKIAVTLTEDLMREHGLMERLLLIYTKIVSSINQTKPDNWWAALGKTVEILTSFIEDYHEKLEEDYIFPLFEKHKRAVQLVKTLREQHAVGRKITAEVRELAAKKTHGQQDKKLIKKLLENFIRMYRPHKAREDTVLFPQIRKLISKKEFEDLSEKFEDIEHERFGKDGFEAMLEKVAHIEKELSIYKLEQFTPIKA